MKSCTGPCDRASELLPYRRVQHAGQLRGRHPRPRYRLPAHLCVPSPQRPRHQRLPSPPRRATQRSARGWRVRSSSSKRSRQSRQRLTQVASSTLPGEPTTATASAPRIVPCGVCNEHRLQRTPPGTGTERHTCSSSLIPPSSDGISGALRINVKCMNKTIFERPAHMRFKSINILLLILIVN